MAKRKYRVASEEGATWATSQIGEGIEVGTTIETELEAGPETALIAAGWLEVADEEKKDTKKEKASG